MTEAPEKAEGTVDVVEYLQPDQAFVTASVLMIDHLTRHSSLGMWAVMRVVDGARSCPRSTPPPTVLAATTRHGDILARLGG